MRRLKICAVACGVVAGLCLWRAKRSEAHVLNGYFMYRADSTVVLVDRRGLVVVTEKINQIGRIGKFVVGETVDPGRIALFDRQFPLGYFMVDTESGKIASGMSVEELTQRLKASNTVVPKLRGPTMWAFLP